MTSIYKLKLGATLLLILPILFISQPATAQFQGEPYSITTFNAGESPFIDVKTSGGHITVSSKKSSKNQVVVMMYVKKNSKWYKDGEADLSDYTIFIDQSGNKITAHAERNSGTGYLSWGDKYSIHFEIHSPRQSRVVAKTSGGHVSANGFEGAVILKTSGGHINIEDLSGGAEVKTSGGHITGVNISGYLDASTSGGHIKLTNIVGEMNVKTSGGHIDIMQSVANIYAKTSGGNISANLTKIIGDVDLRTSGGNITITVPKLTGLDLDLRGSSVNANVENFNGETKRNKMSGKVNGGGALIEAKTSGGRISINSI